MDKNHSQAAGLNWGVGGCARITAHPLSQPPAVGRRGWAKTIPRQPDSTGGWRCALCQRNCTSSVHATMVGRKRWIKAIPGLNRGVGGLCAANITTHSVSQTLTGEKMERELA